MFPKKDIVISTCYILYNADSVEEVRLCVINVGLCVLHRQVEEPALDCEDPVDCRQWTQHHLVAADIRMPPSMALTPPQGEFDTDCMDVNVRGPGNTKQLVRWTLYTCLLVESL